MGAAAERASSPLTVPKQRSPILNVLYYYMKWMLPSVSQTLGRDPFVIRLWAVIFHTFLYIIHKYNARGVDCLIYNNVL